jgi:flagellar assembly protein FliH
MADTDTTARPHNPYARFIPREELKGFAAWRPDSFGAPKVEPEPEVPAAPPESAPGFQAAKELSSSRGMKRL